jgi:spore coat polysaccharide biosynthesis predicted glycosyltransferase SpsG
LKYRIKKKELNKFSLFYIKSKKFGYGHYVRIKNLISILNKKNRIFFQYEYKQGKKNEEKFLKQLNCDVNLNRKIILDFTNEIFLNKNIVLNLKKIFSKKVTAKIYIIDAPIKNNLSSILNYRYAKTLVPFDIEGDCKKNILKIIKPKIGLEYFIYPDKNLKKTKKKYDITVSFGGSDIYNGTLYVLKLLEKCNIKKNTLIIIGKYFKKNYNKKILSICKKNKFSFKFFSENFYNILNKSRILITNSGLTKYEGYKHGLKVLVFSDSKKSQQIDKVFIKKTKQVHFTYLKNMQKDKAKLHKFLNKKSSYKTLDKNIIKFNNKKIFNFF